MACSEGGASGSVLRQYTGSVTADPWTSIAYTSDAGGVSHGGFAVTTGGSSADVAGRAMIIHAYDGSRIGCAILGAATQVTLTAGGFVPYYTYTGNMAVSGTVGPMSTSGTTQSFAWQLGGVDPACSSGAGTAGNSCGSMQTRVDPATAASLAAAPPLLMLPLLLPLLLLRGRGVGPRVHSPHPHGHDVHGRCRWALRSS